MNTLEELWTDSDEKARKLFNEYGIFLTNSFISERWAERLAVEARRSPYKIRNDAVGSLGERGRYWVIPGPRVREIWPDVEMEYRIMRSYAQAVLPEKEVILSPYEMSDINFKIYNKRDSQGLHYDSQPVSALLFLTEGAPLEIQLMTGEWVEVLPYPCLIAIFNGREMKHRVPEGDVERVTMPFNLYFEDDQYRPDWIDEAIYNNKDYVNAES